MFQQSVQEPVKTLGAKNAGSALRYQQGLFESINLRVASMEKRMQNVINLVSIQGGLPLYDCTDSGRSELQFGSSKG